MRLGESSYEMKVLELVLFRTVQYTLLSEVTQAPF